MNRFKILIVDDEKMVRKMIARILESEGMLTYQASNGPDALRMVQEQDFDLIILDIVMEGMDGFQVINELRSLGLLTPVFVLSGRQADNDKVFALGIGADDYVTKPFSTTVLCAKVKACLRRIHISGSKSTCIEAGPFCYICDEMRLLKEECEIPLSSKESFMIKYFMSNPNKVLTKEQIYSNVWGDNAVDDNTIMVHIRRLRTKIEDDPNQPLYLKTVRGVGYQFLIP
ncbi:response regulator transcription factor [Hydrogenoanaerobacterium sp.]|uniref:response regulator transcription factor n=1 Tax=Hydrogenoanaerobacterium sp. TaxID=2953763 RepID=UPI0028965513|nr:response regulator transcription factor [Hydrogenoanaerobacterium sp.]